MVTISLTAAFSAGAAETLTTDARMVLTMVEGFMMCDETDNLVKYEWFWSR